MQVTYEHYMPLRDYALQNIINAEIQGLFSKEWLREFAEIMHYYEIYEKGADFNTEGSNGDYLPSHVKYKNARKLIDKESRFLFSKTPDVTVGLTIPSGVSENEKARINGVESQAQSFLDDVLQTSGFSACLLKAAKDCFIGKRVAIVVNFNGTSGIRLSFLPSPEFVFETDVEDTSMLTKFIAIYTICNGEQNADRRIYKKKFWTEKVGEKNDVWFNEYVYDGLGRELYEISADTKTGLSKIPAFVITNEGLTGDVFGESDIKMLEEYEQLYSHLANADVDAERKGMNPTKWCIDGSPESTANLPCGPGAFWDISSDSTTDGITASVGVLEPTLNYSDKLKNTLDRTMQAMHDIVEVPDLTSDKLQGIVTSGKTLKALYWPLIVRCDEKMLAWRPALVNAIKIIFEGAAIFKDFAKKHGNIDFLSSKDFVGYVVNVENQYPLPEDEAEEKATDMQEVSAELFSKKAYMKKWRGLTDDEAEEELQQMARERQMLEDSFMPQI